MGDDGYENSRQGVEGDGGLTRKLQCKEFTPRKYSITYQEQRLIFIHMAVFLLKQTMEL